MPPLDGEAALFINTILEYSRRIRWSASYKTHELAASEPSPFHPKDTMNFDTMLRQALTLLLILVAIANAHSWVEQLTLIAPNGTFVGNPGYPRGYYPRSLKDVNILMTYLIPPISRANVTLILPTDKMCMDTQQKQTQTDGFPRLQASPGSAIALRYQENGHVTLPQNQAGKPKNRGTVYVYGTTNPKVGEKFLDVLGSWNADGTGGDKRGVLLSKQNFDDGRCYQINNGTISEYRQKEYPHQADQTMGADLWCQQDIRLPSSAPSGKPYTLYWVWDWPTAAGVDPTYPQGKQEIYTTCMDIDVVSKPQSRIQQTYGYVKGQDLNMAAIPSEFDVLTHEEGSQPTGPDAKANTYVVATITSTADTTSAAISGVSVRTTTETMWRTRTKTKTVEGCQRTGTGS